MTNLAFAITGSVLISELTELGVTFRLLPI
jgi:hypothetical protein